MLYILRRLGWAAVLLLAVTIITFVLSHVIPGDPASMMAGFGATRHAVDAMRQEMGLNKPLPLQYIQYLQGLSHLDFGTSVRTGASVSTDLSHFLPATLELALTSFALYVLLAIPLGTLAASRRGHVVDGSFRVTAMIGSAIPVFWLALLFQEFFFAHLGWLPPGGRIDTLAQAPPTITGFYTIDSLLNGNFPLFVSVVKHLILPVTTIVLAMLAVGLRSTRASVVQELDSPYVGTARAKGISEWRLYRTHVLRNAMNPVISVMGLQAGFLLGWIVLVETIFTWPGIGYYAYQSIQTLDYAPIMGLTLVISFAFIIINLLTDFLYPILDPRQRAG
jgi:peptide/nickel transport system permease protein